jgi:hypothetical protein
MPFRRWGREARHGRRALRVRAHYARQNCRREGSPPQKAGATFLWAPVAAIVDGQAAVVSRRMVQPKRKRTAPVAKTWRRGGSDQDWSENEQGRFIARKRRETMSPQRKRREIPPYATRRTKTVRRKKPGRSARNDGGVLQRFTWRPFGAQDELRPPPAKEKKKGARLRRRALH